MRMKFGVQGAGAVHTYHVKGLCTLDLDLQSPGFFVHQIMAVRYAVTLNAVKLIHINIRYGRITAWKNGIKHLVGILSILNLC